MVYMAQNDDAQKAQISLASSLADFFLLNLVRHFAIVLVAGNIMTKFLTVNIHASKQMSSVGKLPNYHLCNEGSYV